MIKKKIGYDLNPPPFIRRMVDRYNMIHKFKFKKDYESNHGQLVSLLHNKFKGKRVFIVGTAPSLNKTNLSLLKDEYVWGVNTLYTAINRIGKIPQFWGVGDVDVFKQYHKELLSLETMLFLTGRASIEFFQNVDAYGDFNFKPICIRTLGRMNYWNRFSDDLKKGVFGGRTVVIDAGIQPAYYLGFDEIYLLGCDCDYSKGHHFDGKEHDHVAVKEGGKPMSKDIDRKRVMDSYRVCKEFIEGHGRKIINCTVGGKLEVFERRKLEDVINEGG